MDRIPLEIYRLIVCMINDEEYPLWAPNKDNSRSKTADGEFSQSIASDQVEPHTTGSQGHSSSFVESTINMQGNLQSRLAIFRTIRPMTLIQKLRARVSGNCKEEELDKASKKTSKRLATLKSLRLCNKKLAAMTAEFVFEKVLLHFTEESHKKLEAVSQHRYRNYVRVLHIVPKAISGSLVPKTEFGQWLRGKRALLDSKTLLGNTHLLYPKDYPKPLVMPDWVRISRKTISFHYEEYSSLHAKQQKLFATAEGILQASVSRFPQLKRVESGLYWDWSRIRHDIPPDDFEPSPRRYWHFERPDISPKDDIIDRVWKAGACQTNFDMDQGAMVLRAIARGRLTSGARIDAGLLFRDLSKPVMLFADPKDEAVVNMLMADTKHLNFYFKTLEIQLEKISPSYNEIVSFLQNMKNLESLRFRSSWTDGEDQIHKAFGNNITWPHLTQLSVMHIDTWEFGGLAALIKRHTASLRRLTLYEIQYNDKAWCNVSATLRAGAMDKMRIWSLVEWVAEAHKLVESGSSHVFSDGAWSPRLGPCLREGVVAKLFPSFAHAQNGLLAEDDEPTRDMRSDT